MKKDFYKNGKIELLRFIFSIIIIMFHLNINFIENNQFPVEHLTFFSHGKIGVEFFFLVTGYLTASNIYKKKNTDSIGKSTANFMAKKYLSIFAYHVVAFSIAIISYFIINPTSPTKAIGRIITALPNFFLIQTTGIYSKNLLGIEWYISSMLLGLVILYPLALKLKKQFTCIICPVAALLMIGYMAHDSGELGQVSEWLYNNTIPKTLIRAVSEMALGMFGYEIYECIKNFNLKKADKIFLTLIEIICYFSVLTFTCLRVDNKYEIYALYTLAVAITLSFSNITYFNNILKNRLVYYLGKLSLPIYLSQNIVFMYIREYAVGLKLRYQIIIVLASCFIIGIIIKTAGDKLYKTINKKIIDMTKHIKYTMQ